MSEFFVKINSKTLESGRFTREKIYEVEAVAEAQNPITRKEEPLFHVRDDREKMIWVPERACQIVTDKTGSS